MCKTPSEVLHCAKTHKSPARICIVSFPARGSTTVRLVPCLYHLYYSIVYAGTSGKFPAPASRQRGQIRIGGWGQKGCIKPLRRRKALRPSHTPFLLLRACMTFTKFVCVLCAAAAALQHGFVGTRTGWMDGDRAKREEKNSRRVGWIEYADHRWPCWPMVANLAIFHISRTAPHRGIQLIDHKTRFWWCASLQGAWFLSCVGNNQPPPIRNLLQGPACM